MFPKRSLSILSLMAFRTSFGLISPCRHHQLLPHSIVAQSAIGSSMLQQNFVGRHSARLHSTNSDGDEAMVDAENDLAMMANVTLVTASQETTLQVQKGEVLRTALLRRGASPHNGRARLINCRGLGTCGTCAVEIEGSISPRDRNTKERLRLNFPPHGSPDQSPNLRLACQVQVQKDIMVRKRTGFWGQDTEELAEAYDAELWFGDLEYVLDNKSPPKEDK